jgi:hypothetical protein
MHYPNPRLGLVIGLNRVPLIMLSVPLLTGVASLALPTAYWSCFLSTSVGVCDQDWAGGGETTSREPMSLSKSILLYLSARALPPPALGCATHFFLAPRAALKSYHQQPSASQPHFPASRAAPMITTTTMMPTTCHSVESMTVAPNLAAARSVHPRPHCLCEWPPETSPPE